MARFLYFLPGSVAANMGGVSVDHVKRVLAGAEVVFRGCKEGPNGEPGVVCMAVEKDDAERATVAGFFPDRQTWMDCGEFWLGWETENTPGPEDLWGPKPVGGDPVALGDGREWVAPLLGPAELQMPRYLRRATGGCEAVLRDEYRPICKESEYWFDILCAREDYPLTRFFDFAVDALSCNYRIGAAEAGALKLIGTEPEVNTAFLVTVVGLKRATGELKKKRPDGASSEPDGK